MKGKRGIRRTCKYLADFQKKHGYIPLFLMEGVAGMSVMKERVYTTRVLEKKYPQVLAAIRAWELDADPGPDGGEPAAHPPQPARVKASGMSVQRKLEQEMMFS